MEIFEIAWLTFKWGFGISLGILVIGVVELVIYLIAWKMFQIFFEPVEKDRL